MKYPNPAKPPARRLAACGVILVLLSLRGFGLDDSTPVGEQNYVKQSLRFSPQPEYPPVGRIGGIEGWCIVQFDIAVTGQTENHSILECEPTQVFEETSLAAAKDIQYTPAMQGGEPVPVTGHKLKYRFVLTDVAAHDLAPENRPDTSMKILIMPLSTGLEIIDASGSPLFSAIADVLTEDGYASQFMPVEDVKAVSETIRTEIGGLFDPMTGMPDRRKVGLYTVKLIGAVGGEGYGAVIIPALELRLAPLKKGWATWDGVTRYGNGQFSEGGKGKFGDISAVVSVRISCFAPGGQILFSRLGGLDFLVNGDGKFWVEPSMYPGVLADRDKVAEAVRIALAPLRPPSPEIRNAPGDTVAYAGAAVSIVADPNAP